MRVLIVDDSPVVRSALKKALSEDPLIEVVGEATDPMDATSRIPALRPDVLTLDVEMPGMDGLTFLSRLMQSSPMPVVMVSSKARRSSKLVLEALQAGAVAVVPKPHAAYPLANMIEDLKVTIRTAAASRPKLQGAPPAPQRAASMPAARAAGSLIAVGSSTGGTVAFETFAAGLPQGHPCVVLAQHLPIDFIPRFAERLSEILPSTIAVAEGGEELRPGHIYIAPGTHHLQVRKESGRLVTSLYDGPLVNFHKPSVDVLMLSVAASAGRAAAGVMLTGMGADGARGMLAMKQAGSFTVVQDEASCVVYGMPRSALEIGAACDQQPLDRLAQRVIDSFLRAPSAEPPKAPAQARMR